MCVANLSLPLTNNELLASHIVKQSETQVDCTENPAKLLAPSNLKAQLGQILASKGNNRIEKLQKFLAENNVYPRTDPKVEGAFERVARAYQDAKLSSSDLSSISRDQHNIIEANKANVDALNTNMRNQRLYNQQSASMLSQTLDTTQAQSNESDPITTSTSYAELWARLALAIAGIKRDYVDFYADLMQQYTQLYESFNENVQKASSEAVSSGDDGNNVKFDINRMEKGYQDFQRDVDRLNSELGSVPDWATMTPESQESMVATLEPAFKVDNHGKISFNLDQYNSIQGTYPSGIKNGQVSTASYQAWLATFNAAGNALQNNMQSFAQRYSQANSTFDNINKVLSGAISSMADSAKEVLRAL